MKKIGIITIYDENNYGNRLQNYAVQEVLKSMNFEVETIKNTNLINGKNNLESALKIEPARRNKFLEFNKENMNNTEEVIFHNDIPEDLGDRYDYFVIGSDQIWNCNFRDKFGKLVFAEFAPYEKRIAYSASFGISEIPKDKEGDYEGLKTLKCISVRENAGKDIVKKLAGRDDAIVLLDPTMMLDSAKWESIMKKPEQLNSNKYILKYFLGNVSEEKEKEIQRFAKENGCDVIDILDKESFYATGPSEFLYLIKNAFLVLTDSFHSCIFSIIFERPFMIFDRDEDGMRNMNSRIETLLQKFDLPNRKYVGKITENNIKIDYSKIPEILSIEQEKARRYLRQALDIEE